MGRLGYSDIAQEFSLPCSCEGILIGRPGYSDIVHELSFPCMCEGIFMGRPGYSEVVRKLSLPCLCEGIFMGRPGYSDIVHELIQAGSNPLILKRKKKLCYNFVPIAVVGVYILVRATKLLQIKPQGF